MERKTVLRKILQESKSGNIPEVLNLIEKNRVYLQENYALNIVVDCSTSFNNGNINIEELTKLLRLVVKFIDDPKESYSLAYLQSVYHILKFYISGNHFKQLQKLEKFVVPPFLSKKLKVLPEPLRKVYKAICGQFSHMIHDLKLSDRNQILSLINFASEIFMKIAPLKDIFNFAYTAIFKLNSLKFGIKFEVDYYFGMLQMLRDEDTNINSNYNEEDCESFFTMFTYLWSNILKEYDFDKFDLVYYNSLEYFKGIECVKKSITSLGIILNYLPHSPHNKNSIENLTYVMYNSSKSKICNVLCCLFYPVVSYYKNNEKLWININENDQILLLETLKNIFVMISEENTCCCNQESINENCFENQRIFEYIYALSKITLKNNTASNDYCTKILDLFKELYILAKKYSNEKCQNIQNVFKTLNIHIYNLSVCLYKFKNSQCIEFFTLFLHYSLKFNIIDDQTTKMQTVSFNSICEIYFNSKHFKKCMIFTALLTLISKEQDTRMTSLKYYWIRSKASLKEETSHKNDVRHSTLVSILENNKKTTDCIIDTTRFLDTASKIELLCLELECYKLKWFSREPVSAAFKHLYSISDLMTSVKMGVKIFGDCHNVNLHNDCLKIVQKILLEFERRVDTPESDCDKYYFGTLYYLKYKYTLGNLIEKQKDDLEKSLMIINENVVSENEPPDAIPKDPSDDCAVVSSNENLRLDKFLVTIKMLDKSLDFFEKLNFERIDESNFEIMCNIILKIACEYRLQKLYLQSYKAFKLVLTLHEYKKRDIESLNIIQFILEHKNINANLLNKYIMRGDDILKRLEGSADNIKTILHFLINKSNALFSINPNLSHETFKKAEIIFESHKNIEESFLVKIKLLYMRHRFLNDIQCDLKIEKHNYTSIFHIVEAHTIFYNELVNINLSNNSKIMADLLDLNEEVVRLFYNLKLPRDIKYYSKEILLWCQKMLIPLRCISYLCYLSYADLLSCKYDDCKLKIDAIDEILCYQKNCSHTPLVKPEKIEEKNRNDIVDLTNSIQEMVLDLPEPYRVQFSYSSPSLEVKSFKMPSFLNHLQNCLCFFCTNTEYHKFLLFKTNIEALCHDYQKNSSIASNFFKSNIIFYEKLIKFYDDKEKIDKILEIGCQIYLEYANNLIRNCENDLAKEINAKVLNIVENKKTMLCSYIYREAIFQYICLNFSTNIDEPVSNIPDIIETSQPIILTPESKLSQITLSMSGIPTVSPLKKRLRKPRKFNLSPECPELDTCVKLSESESSKTKISRKPLKSSKENVMELPESPKHSSIKKRTVKSKTQPVIYGTNFVLTSTSKNENLAKSTGLKKKTACLAENLGSKKDNAKKETKVTRRNLSKEIGDGAAGSSVNARSNRKKT